MNIQGQQSAKKREQPPETGFQFGKQDEEWKLNKGPSIGQTGPHSVLDSPSKSGFATPNRLRDPDNRPFYFAQDGNKPLPLPPHVQNDAWAPRTPASVYDFSSGGETPNTPAADSDAATPDTSLADKMGRLGNGDANSPKKAGRRESFFKRMLGGSPSPTKAPREKEEARPLYSHKAEHRIQKKRSERSERSRSKKRADMLHGYGDDSDNERAGRAMAAPPLPLPQAQGKTYAMSIAGFLHWVEAHPHLPSVLSFYMQLMVNIFLAAGFIYILYSAWAAIISDVDIESSKHMSEVLVDIALCAKQYNVNRCDQVVPELEKVCGVWKTCMSRDPKKVARASVTAKTFAMIFNSFVEEFSYKSMVCVALFSILPIWTITTVNARWRPVSTMADRYEHMSDNERVMYRRFWEAQAHGCPISPQHWTPDRVEVEQVHDNEPEHDRGFTDHMIE